MADKLYDCNNFDMWRNLRNAEKLSKCSKFCYFKSKVYEYTSCMCYYRDIPKYDKGKKILEIFKDMVSSREEKLSKIDYSQFLQDDEKEHWLFIDARKIKLERVKRLEIIYRREIKIRCIVHKDVIGNSVVGDYIKNRKSIYISLNDGENVFKATPGYMQNAIGETRHFENIFDIHINLLDMEAPKKIKFDCNRFEMMDL